MTEQSFALVLALSKPTSERPREGHLHEYQHDECTERDRCEAPPKSRPRRVHCVVPVVRLEQERLTARRPDRQVNLEELAVLPLEPVLRRGQVAHFGDD